LIYYILKESLTFLLVFRMEIVFLGPE